MYTEVDLSHGITSWPADGCDYYKDWKQCRHLCIIIYYFIHCHIKINVPFPMLHGRWRKVVRWNAKLRPWGWGYFKIPDGHSRATPRAGLSCRPPWGDGWPGRAGLWTGGPGRSRPSRRASLVADSEHRSCQQGCAGFDATPLHQIYALHHPMGACMYGHVCV